MLPDRLFLYHLGHIGDPVVLSFFLHYFAFLFNCLAVVWPKLARQLVLGRALRGSFHCSSLLCKT